MDEMETHVQDQTDFYWVIERKMGSQTDIET